MMCTGLRSAVVPYVGTWIEISYIASISVSVGVVPYVGTWIEIFDKLCSFFFRKVVPYVGTWIEINILFRSFNVDECRSLRGNVDRNT